VCEQDVAGRRRSRAPSWQQCSEAEWHLKLRCGGPNALVPRGNAFHRVEPPRGNRRREMRRTACSLLLTLSCTHRRVTHRQDTLLPATSTPRLVIPPARRVVPCAPRQPDIQSQRPLQTPALPKYTSSEYSVILLQPIAAICLSEDSPCDRFPTILPTRPRPTNLACQQHASTCLRRPR
jgi:hypothetical protein